MATPDQIDTTTKHYLIALLWTMPGDDECETPGDNIWYDDLPDETIDEAKADVTCFVELCGSLFDQTMECFSEAAFGHDFALTRNRQGVGFWDRSNEGLPKFLGDALTRVCQKNFSEADLYIGDDGKAYF